MVNRNILYGDDNEGNRLKVAESLRERGYEVDLTNSPQELVSKARNGNYSAVISDLEYSPNGTEGYEVIRQMRNLPTLKILFTGRAGLENAVEALEGGADWVVFHKSLGELVKILDNSLKGGDENGINRR
jgi:CheY-like chemotaxis protein